MCSSTKLSKAQGRAADDLIYKTRDSRASKQSHYSKKKEPTKKERKETSLQGLVKED